MASEQRLVRLSTATNTFLTQLVQDHVMYTFMIHQVHTCATSRIGSHRQLFELSPPAQVQVLQRNEADNAVRQMGLTGAAIRKIQHCEPPCPGKQRRRRCGGGAQVSQLRQQGGCARGWGRALRCRQLGLNRRQLAGGMAAEQLLQSQGCGLVERAVSAAKSRRVHMGDLRMPRRMCSTASRRPRH